MNSCATLQAQLLDHLYGLLDDGSDRALREHLASCADCQAARVAVEAQRRLLAAAAKAEFPGVTFQPPQTVATTADSLRSVVLLNRARAFPKWAGWAAAAGILLVVGLAGGWSWLHLLDLRQSAESAQAAQQQFQQETDRLDRAREDEERQNRTRIAALQFEIAKLIQRRKRQRLRVRVTGPETIQAGSRNHFLVHTENLADEPVPAKVDVKLYEAKAGADDVPAGQPIFEKEGLRSRQGTCPVVLPPDLPQKPGKHYYLKVVARRTDNGARVGIKPVDLRLIAPLYLTHLATDKPMYQPGQVASFRSLTLERFSLKAVDKPLILTYRVTDPRGAEVYRVRGENRLTHPDPKVAAVRGVGVGSYSIPPSAPGGVYTLSVSVAARGDAGRPSLLQEQQRKFIVNRYRKPRLNKELEFTRKSYGPGQQVVAACRVSRVEGGKPLAGRKVAATVTVDGQTVNRVGKVVQGPSSGITLTTDSRGAVEVRFRLPARIKVGEASLAVRFTDGISHETLVRSIPIVLDRLEVEFFPEGGDLVASVPSRVYFQVRTPAGKPAELKGHIVDSQGKRVARVETLHDDHHPGANQGMGVFVLAKPDPGQTYQLKIDSPGGIRGTFRLPKVVTDGVGLRIPGVVAGRIPVTLHNGKEGRKLLVGAYCRGRLLDHTTLTVKAFEEAHVTLQPQAGVGGVYRVTVFEELDDGKALKPLAERLIFHQPPHRLDVSVRTDKKHYTPGEKVRLTLSADNEKKQPAPAVMMVAVVDKSVLTLADEKTARSMPTQFFLMTEVRSPEELEHADFLLTDNPLAARALDLLLGTQGWRRFAEQQDPRAFQKKQKKDAERLLVMSGRKPLLKGMAAQPEAAPGDKFALQLAKKQGKVNKVQATNTQSANTYWNVRNRLQTSVFGAEKQTARANARADDYARTARTIWLSVLGVLLGLAGIGVLVIGAVRLSRHEGGAMPLAYYATGLGGLVLCVGVVSWAIYLHDNDPRQEQMAKTSTPEAGRFQVQRGNEGFPQGAKGMPRFGGGMGAPGARDEAEMAPPGGARMMKKAAPAGPAKPQPAPPVEAKQQFKGPAMGGPGNSPPLKALRPAVRPRDPAKHVAPILPPPNLKQVPGGVPAVQPFVVREYAHRHRPGPKNTRTDFAETLYWHPVLVLPDGRGEVAFDLCDSVTTFQVLAFAHTADGRLGAAKTDLESRLPFSLHPAAPLEVTANDTLTIPLAVRNATDTARAVKITVETHGLKLLGKGDRQLRVEGETGVRELFRFRPTITRGEARLVFTGVCEPFARDRVEVRIRVVPDGFPVSKAHSGLLEKVARHRVKLPADCFPETLTMQVQVFPSTLADLQKGLEGLLREPHGCFEQTSTSNYPNVLILDYLQANKQTNPDVVRRARQLLDDGYRKLTQFECQPPGKAKRGYEWFGGAVPPHEALTAYGLLQFRDMARVYPVDKDMLKRTRQFLMDQKDGKGGFLRNQKALDGFGAAPPHITNAYIVWSLTESGKDDDVDKELAGLARQAKTSTDPYFLALVANSLLNRGKGAEARPLLGALAKAQDKDGHLDGKETSITRSGGRDLQIETTALAVLAWLKANRPDYTLNLNRAIKWVGGQRGGYGGFGSTQSTILALKALIAYTREHQRTAAPGQLILYVNGKKVGRRHFPKGVQEVLRVSVPRPREVLRPGQENRVRVVITGKNQFPYTLGWSYRVKTPGSGKACPVQLSTRLDRTEVKEADRVRLTIEVANRTGKGQGMAVAVVGLPAGLKVPEDLKQLTGYVRLRDNAPKAEGNNLYISAFEIRGRELVLYWRDLAPAEKIRVNLDLVGWVPGKYRGPASRAYLYYNADKKHWREPLAVNVAPRDD
jgi:hypothetical protein